MFLDGKQDRAKVKTIRRKISDLFDRGAWERNWLP